MVLSFRSTLVGTAALVALSATPALANPPTIFDNIQGWDFSAEGAYLMGSGDLPYAQYYDEHTKNYAFKVDPGNGWDGAFTANARFDDGTNFRATYTHMSSSQSAGTASYNSSNAASDYPVWNILGYLNNRAPNGATSWNRATVTTDVRADVVDLQIGHDVGLGLDGDFMLLWGVRIADYEQNSTADIYSYGSPGSLEVTTHRASHFSGAGPQIGGTYNRATGMPGFGLYGSALASAILGKQSSNNVSTFDSVTSDSRFGDTHFAYTFDAKAGLSYTMPDCPVVVMAGYQASYLSAVRDSENEALADGTSTTFGSHHANLFYHGPFLRLTYSPF